MPAVGPASAAQIAYSERFALGLGLFPQCFPNGSRRSLRRNERFVKRCPFRARWRPMPSRLEAGRNERHRQRCIRSPAAPCCARLNRQKGDSNSFQLETGRNERAPYWVPLGPDSDLPVLYQHTLLSQGHASTFTVKRSWPGGCHECEVRGLRHWGRRWLRA